MKRPVDNKLIGKYKPPRVLPGDVLFDERFGECVVTCYTDRMRWPCSTRYGYPGSILCDDLVKAVKTESVRAICYWWEVSRTTVHTWRVCLGVGRMTPGTRRLKVMQTFNDAERKRSGKTKKTARCRNRQRELATKAWADGKFGKPWSKRELAILRMYSNEQVVKRTGRSIFAVRAKRACP